MGGAQKRPQRVTIIGGGAAGCITAFQLLERDRDGTLRIDIHEMSKDAHTTLCGEGISAATLDRFRGFDSRPHVAQTFPGASWRFPAPDGSVTVLVDQPCHTIERATWIPAMAEELERRGVRFHYGSKPRAAEIRELPGDLVVGCDGPGSKTRSLIPKASVRLRVGLQYRVADSGHETDRLEFVTDKEFSPEYAWIFPKGDIQNVGTLGYEDRQDWQRLDRFMAHMKVGGRVVKRETYPIAFGGRHHQAGRYALIGDAAGLTNPVTKGGLAAIIFASEILADCWEQGRMDEYEKRVRRHPISSRSFERTLAIVERSTNDDIARLLRYVPTEVRVGGNGDGRAPRGPLLGATPNDPQFRMLLRTMAGMPHKVPILWTLYKALALSRRYSW